MDATQTHQTTESSVSPDYFKVRPIPRQLKDQVQIYFEEQLYSLALTLLTNILSSGASSEKYPFVPRLIPPPSHIAFICTLIVHPRTTSRAESLEARNAATMAQRYLHNLLHMVGPIGGRFKQAFQFKTPGNRRQRDAADGEAWTAGSESDDDDRIGGHVARETNLWTSGADFWGVVGWALNCSVAHPVRWECWREWLEFMLDVLRADWAYHLEFSRDMDAETIETVMQDTLIVSYLSDKASRNSCFKWVKKALFADGKAAAASVFQEVFPKETKEAPRQQVRRKHSEAMDLENDKFGDYDSDGNSSSDNEIPDPMTLPIESSLLDPPSFVDLDLSGDEIDLYIESIPMRLKLINMLSDVAVLFGRDFIVVDDFYEEIARELRQLPFPMFQAYTRFTGTVLTISQYIFLMRELFYQLLPPSHTKPAKVDKSAAADGWITQDILEQCFLPYPAAAMACRDNAQVQFLCEQTIIALNADASVAWSEELVDAAEKGVVARLKKVKQSRGVKDKDTAAREMLESAPQRMKMILANVRESVA
ncbi:hypothetical protein TD95_005007 [Thielaviopsis punctulata]|uniref:Uncharacterized protein n=1 Tax=Thielaviopsis punctulata TaxID=72032 RepID=A0A0F4ZGG1_9PEZI|nr:hypothetical protein TD95_005007 [Thielaviopsis punctulata]